LADALALIRPTIRRARLVGWISGSASTEKRF